MSGEKRGFTLVEIMVAVAVSTVLFGACVAIYINVSRFKSRSEKLLFLHETARGINTRLGRDLAGLHVADTDGDGDTQLADYWKLEKAPVAGCSGDRLTFLAAVENPGKVDYCTVAYYVEDGKLYREVSDIMGGVPPAAPAWPDKGLLAEGVERLTVVAEPVVPAAGKLPATVTVTLKLADPGGNPASRHFTVTLRPGPEEN